MQDLLLKMNTKSWSLAKEKAYETIEDHFSCLKTALEKRKGELIKAVDEAFHQYGIYPYFFHFNIIKQIQTS